MIPTMPGCVAVNCTKRSEHGLRLFGFPADNIRREKWLKNMCRNDWTPTKSSYLCETHFEESQFENGRADGWRKLKPNAVPTLFNFPNSPPKMSTPSTDLMYKKLNEEASPSMSTSDKSEPAASPLQTKSEDTSILVCEGSPYTSRLRVSTNQDTGPVQKTESIAILDVRGTSIPKSMEPAEDHPVVEVVGHSDRRKFYGKNGRFFQPRYVSEILPSDLENPRKAKLSLFLAKNTLIKQTKMIKQLKNETRSLYRKLDRLRNLFKLAKKSNKIPNKNKETITLLVNL